MPSPSVIEINDEFVDVDFQKDPNFVFGDLGVKFGSVADDYTKVVDIIPRNLWEGICQICGSFVYFLLADFQKSPYFLTIYGIRKQLVYEKVFK